VYGGTSSGVIAAYTAQKLGKQVILIEPGKKFGGLTSGGQGSTVIKNKFVVNGLARDFYRRVGRYYGKLEQFSFEPKVAQSILTDYIERGNFEVFTELHVVEVRKEGSLITEVVFKNSSNTDDRSTIVVSAKMFIDCGYEGDLMAKAGVPYTIGRESNSEFNETLNGFQFSQGEGLLSDLNPYNHPGKSRSGLVWGVSSDSILTNGEADNHLQGYTYHMCLTAVPDNMVPISRPENYDAAKYELLLRLLKTQPKKKLRDVLRIKRLPNSKADVTIADAFALVGTDKHYAEASYDDRKNILAEHEAFAKGLLFFLGHDVRVPEPIRTEMLMWGYSMDEFIDNGNWPTQLDIRAGRRMNGKYVMTQANCEGSRFVDDAIALAANNIQVFNCNRIVYKGSVRNEGHVENEIIRPFKLSFGSLVPKEEFAGNLIVPVCLSATHIAYSSIGSEPTFMELGQVAATAASIAIDEAVGIQNINIRKLQTWLGQNPLADGRLPDVLVDNEDKHHVKLSGKKWKVNEGGYRSSFLVSEPNEKKVNSIRFTPPGLQPLRYNVYIYLPKISGATEFMTAKISDGIKICERVLKPANLVTEDQAPGEWVSLGQYEIKPGTQPFVELTTLGTSGKIVADAVLWAPVTQEEALIMAR
jgi:hypothetical protein